MKIYSLNSTVIAVENWTSDLEVNKELVKRGIPDYKFLKGTPGSVMYYEHPAKILFN